MTRLGEHWCISCQRVWLCVDDACHEPFHAACVRCRGHYLRDILVGVTIGLLWTIVWSGIMWLRWG